MSRKNGGIIGPANTPVGGIITGVASGVWRPNDLLNFVSNNQWPPAPENIENSVRMDGDQSDDSLSKSISGVSITKFTLSFWTKYSGAQNIGSEGPIVFSSENNSSDYISFQFNTANEIDFQFKGTQNRRITTRKFRDPSAWYHIMVVIDTTQSTASDRLKIYVNGSQETAFGTSTTNVSQDASISPLDETLNYSIGRYNGASSDFCYDGYLAEFVAVYGQALTPSSFGETDTASGIWKPKKIGQIANAGSNSFYLNFKDSSNLGKDESGNSNNFTVNNLTSVDQSTDSCVENFATMNSIVPTPDASWAEGNLQVTGSDATEYSANNTSTIGVSSGKWYMEVEYDSAGSNTNPYVGICPMSASETTNMTGSVTDACVVRMDNEIYKEGSATSSFFGSSISAGNTIGIALDMDNQKVWFHLNGTYPNSGNPATGANAAFDGITSGETMAFCVRPLNATFKLNFGSPPYSISSGNSDANGFGNFEYSVPSGFFALNTSNLNTYG